MSCNLFITLHYFYLYITFLFEKNSTLNIYHIIQILLYYYTYKKKDCCNSKNWNNYYNLEKYQIIIHSIIHELTRLKEIKI